MRKNNIFDKNNSKQLKEYNNENKLTAKIWKEQKQKTNNHKYLEITLFGKENSKGMEKILRTVTTVDQRYYINLENCIVREQRIITMIWNWTSCKTKKQ